MIEHDELSLVGTARKPGLLDWVRSGELVLPEFQREFLWLRKPDKTASLLASVAQEWPAGALLLMEGDRGFQTHRVQGWKQDSSHPASKMRFAILDGQQRMTALYQAYFNRSPTYAFYIAIEQLRIEGEVDPEEGGTFRSMPRRQWERRFGSMEKRQEAGIVTVADLVNPKAWEHWKDGFDSSMKAELNELREEGPLSGLLRYRFPVSTVLPTAPDEVLANIFVTINQQGIKLTTFDLVVARTVRRASRGRLAFNLRDVWERAAGREETEDEPAIIPQHERLRTFQIEPEVPLKLVRLMSDQNSKLSDTSILKLKPADVHQRIDAALKAIESALAFLEDRVALIPSTLPDANYLLPVALVAHMKPAVLRTANSASRLEQWWWAATFRMVFGRGQTGDLIPQETRALVDWLIQRGSEAAVVTRFWPTFNQELRQRLFQGPAQNGHLMRALFALEVAAGARDWRGKPEGDSKFKAFPLGHAGTWPPTPLDVHHIWARGVKKPTKAKSKIRGIDVPHGETAHEAIINRCLLLKSTNVAIGSAPFTGVARLENIAVKNIATYLIDPKAGTWETFLESRLRKVEAALVQRLPRNS